MTTGNLTIRQRRFVEEYVKDWNATRAAIRAGYSAATAHSSGPRLLENVGVAKAIEAVRAELAEAAGVTVRTIVEGLLTEARFAARGASHSARVSAWAHLARYAGMFQDKGESEGEDIKPMERVRLARQRAIEQPGSNVVDMGEARGEGPHGAQKVGQ